MEITDLEVQGLHTFYGKYVGKYFISRDGIAKIDAVSGRLWHCTYYQNEDNPESTFTQEYSHFEMFFDTKEKAIEWAEVIRQRKQKRLRELSGGRNET